MMSKNSIVPFLKDYLIKFLTRPFLLDTNDYKDKIDKRNRDLIKKNRDLIEKKHKEKATRRKAIIVSILFSFLLVIGLMICFYVFFFVLDWIF